MYHFGYYHSYAAVKNAAEAKTSAGRAQNEIREMRKDMDRLALAMEAMWTLVRDKVGITPEELQAKMHDIDLSDGELDGRVRRAIQNCPNCNRPVNRRLTKCMYCEHPVPREGLA